MTDDAAHHARNQAIAVLAIATAVLGFGLFSIDFRGMTAFVDEKGPLTGFLHAAAMFAFAIAAFMFYLSLIIRVGRLLHKPDASSSDVAAGPLNSMTCITARVGLVLLLNRL